MFLGGLVSYFAPGQLDISRKDAYWYASGIVLCPLVSVITFHPFIYYIMQVGMKIRIGCSGLIYSKVSLCQPSKFIFIPSLFVVSGA
jgi:ATP-binding cassette, subfamily C (CFTR/MRP), member 4